MAAILDKFPLERVRVLFGGYVKFSLSPVPEFNYVVPLEFISESGKPYGQVFFAEAGIGDIVNLAPCSVFNKGVRVESDPHPLAPDDIVIRIERSPQVRERELSKLINSFTPETDRHSYFSSLRKAVMDYPGLARAPMVVARSVEENVYVLCCAAEWYRVVYGRKSYTAHAFLASSEEAILDHLIVVDETESVPGSTLQLANGVAADEDYLGFVPRTNLDDESIHLVVPLWLSKECLQNAAYATNSIRADVVKNIEPWLRYGHPFPDQSLKIYARGIYGKLSYCTKDSIDETARVFFATSLCGYDPPDVPNFFIKYRENDGRSPDGYDQSDTSLDLAPDPENSEENFLSKNAQKNKGEDSTIIINPDESPAADTKSEVYVGGIADLVDHKKPLKQRVLRRADTELPIYRVREIKTSIEEQSKSTHINKSRLAAAGHAAFTPQKPFDNDRGLGMVVFTLNKLHAEGLIDRLGPLEFRRSDYHNQGISLQKFVKRGTNITRGGWATVGGNNKRQRLILCMTFLYRGSYFVIFDPELRTPKDHFKLIVLSNDTWSKSNAPSLALATDMALVIEKARGIAGNMDVSKIEAQMTALIHKKDKNHGGRALSQHYLLKSLDSLILG